MTDASTTTDPAPSTTRTPSATGSAAPSVEGYVAVPVPHTEDELAGITFGPDGLVVAVVQDATDGAVLMVAYMNAESLRRTLDTGRTWFWSRSRQEFWCKGETSGERQYVSHLAYDCDGDALLVIVDQEGGGACHTGNRTCFYRAFGDPVTAP